MISERASGVGSYLAGWVKRAEERKRWEAEHPEEAAAQAAAEEERERAATAAEALRWRRLFVASIPRELHAMGAPSRIAEAIFAEEDRAERGEPRRFDQTEAAVAARAFVESRKSMLLLFGGVGAGKSTAAAWTLLRARSVGNEPHEITLDPTRGMFVRATELARMSKFDDGGEWARVLRVRWLVVDDLGVENMGDFWAERINELLDVRYGDRLRTVLTANKSRDEFKAIYGDRIVSRIRDDGLVANAGDVDLRRSA